MAEKKLKKLSKKASPKRTAETIKESASQIWLAGLGAFARAQEEGGKIFEALVKEGQSLESKTRKATGATVNEVRGVVQGTVEQMQSKASASWDKLEKIFEDRVAKALAGLGVPTAGEIKELTGRVRELQKAVHELAEKTPGKKPAAVKKATRKKAAPKKTAARKKASKKTASKKTASKS